MLYGVSYYPEQKTRKDLEHDLELLKASGINTVRMGEFAWCRFEPTEGEYHFEWLDQVVEELGRAGIKTVICTPTACPPAWMIEKNPDILYTDNRGITRPFGGRRHYCYNNETYRKYSANIADQIGSHYGNNPYIVGFQIDNEPAQEGTGRCCCPTCKEKFSKWLSDKYGTIDVFNERSGGIFWSQEYTSFSQINPPVNSIEVGAGQQIQAFYENPTVRLEFERFSSDSQIEYQNIQTAILKKHTNYPITTNATGLATNSINNYKSTQMLDNYAFDYYPGLRDAVVDSFPYAFARGVKEGKPFWILEFMSGGGHRLSGSGRVQPNPGALKQAVIQSFAHGANMMLHFQFRSYPMGAEQLNYAIVDLDGVPRRRYFEMQDTAEILQKLEPYEKSEFHNEVAICLDYDTHWALRIKPVNDPEFHYLDYCGSIYHKFAKIGVNADVISMNQDFSKYKIIVLPSAFVLPNYMRQKLKDYVKAGGVLVSTFLTSVKNEDNIGYTETLPAGLTDLFGVSVEEVEPVFDQNHTKINLSLKSGIVESTDGIWSELLSGTAQIIGTYTQDYKTNQGVISKNKFQDGFAYYLGTNLEDEVMCTFIEDICKEHHIFKNRICTNEKIDVVRRIYEGRDLYFIFNFTGKDTQVTFHGAMEDCLSQQIYEGGCSIERNGFRILI